MNSGRLLAKQLLGRLGGRRGSLVCKADAPTAPKKRKRMSDADISMISLVPKGANRLPVVYKSDDTVEIQTLVKYDEADELGELLAIVYAPELEDSQGDIASADVVKDMAYGFAKKGLGEIDLRHNGKAVTREQAFVAESFIVQKGDSRFGGMKDYDGQPVGDLTGAWAVLIKILDPDLRKLYKEGEWNGVSMFGYARREEESVEKAEKSRMRTLLERIANHMGISSDSVYAHQSLTIHGDIDMKPEELQALLAKNNADVGTAVVKAMVEAGVIKSADQVAKEKADADAASKEAERVAKEKADAAKPKAPVFKGDLSNPNDIELFRYQKERFEIEKSVDLTDPESVATAAAELADLEKEYEGIADLIKESRKVSKSGARRRPSPSNAPESNGSDRSDRDSGSFLLSKEDREGIESGKRMAKAINSSRGMEVASA